MSITIEHMVESPQHERSVEYEFVTSLIGDMTQLINVQDISPQMFADPNLAIVYEALRRGNGTVSAASLYYDVVDTFHGEQALRTIGEAMSPPRSPQDAVLIMFDDGIYAPAAEAAAERIRSADTVRRIKRALSEVKHERYANKTEWGIAVASYITDVVSKSGGGATGNALEAGVQEELEDYRLKQANPHLIPGVRVNLGEYDDLTGGLTPGELILIGGHSGEGKSQMMIHMAIEAATTPMDLTGEPPVVAFFSIEMSRRQIASRIVSKVAGITMSEKYPTDDQVRRIEAASQHVVQLGRDNKLIIIESHRANTIEQIARELVRLSQQHGMKVAFIDYAQLIRSSGSISASNYERLAEISQRLKTLSIQLNIAIVMGVQLNRDALQNSYAGRPKLYHVADSLDLVRSADVVHMIWTPARHLQGERIGPWQDIAVLTTEKVRNRGYIPWLYYLYRPDRATFEPVSAQVRAQLMSPDVQKIINQPRAYARKGQDAA
ncbi:MAG: DnaB-like helicase C-terminal domain-containing protein [Thermomicrobiales bacterium]